MRQVRAAMILVGLLAATAALHAAEPSEAKPNPVRAVLELSRQFYYAGQPLEVRLSIGSDADQPLANPVRGPLLKSFVVSQDGTPLKRSTTVSAKEPVRPDKLAPRTFYGTIADLTELFPNLRKPGRYEVRWAADGIESQTIVVTLIPPYDSAKDYVARVETDEGSFVIDFFKKTAPIATKAFIDMAQSGFYDGLLFHEVRPDWFVAGGDPQGDGSGSPPFRYPADPPVVPVVAGTVVMKPVSPTPPSNGSQFMVTLRPEPSWAGQVTVLGQVVDGLEVVRRISRLPSSQQSERPYFKPLKDIRIKKVTVTEKTAPVNPGS